MNHGDTQLMNQYQNDPRDALPISESDMAWLAGILDGDGYISSTGIGMQLIDPSLLEAVAELLGTNITTYDPRTHTNTTADTTNWSLVYRTTLGRKPRLEYIAPKIYPYMSQYRQKQIHTLMERIDPTGQWLQNVSPSMFAGKSLPQPKEKIQTPPREFTQLEWAWFTGYFEAEGHVSFDRRAYIPRPGLCIQSTDQEIIAYLSQSFSKSYVEEKRRTKGNNPVFTFAITQLNKAESMFQAMMPYFHGEHKLAEVKKALGMLEEHHRWKALPSKARPSMYPPRKPKKAEKDS